MINIKTPSEIELMRQGGKILAFVLGEVVKAVRPGIVTAELDRLAEALLWQQGALPAFKGFEDYPASLCVSINEQVVHALPSQRKLQAGDVVGLDLGALYPAQNCSVCPTGGAGCGGQPGLFTDMAVTVATGEVSPQAKKLMAAAGGALETALRVIRPGRKVGAVSKAIQQYVEKAGFCVIRDLVGHGVGRALHEEPSIPNFVGGNFPDAVLEAGMTLAIEPMISLGRGEVKKSADGFGYETADKSLAAHFEHTVAVTKNGCELLTEI